MGIENETKKIEVLENKVSTLERQMALVMNELRELKKEFVSMDENEWKNNIVDNYMIKLVFPTIYCSIDDVKAGFPKNRKKVCEQLYPGQYMFIYVTSPVKKIIGLAKVASSITENPGNRWPYVVDLEWVIKPRLGLTLKECGLDIRPRPGDTLYSITESKAQEIIDKLKAQDELDESTLKYLASEYKESTN